MPGTLSSQGGPPLPEARRVRIGVLGCGPIAQVAHFDACRKARNAQLYAVCDRAPDLLAAALRRHQPQVAYSDFSHMLADPQVDAVIVATADAYHVSLAAQALAAGKHVLVEKPLGTDVDECEGLSHQVAGSNLVLQVGNNKRFDPGIAYARRFILNRLGERLALKAWYCDSIYRYTMTDNLQAQVITSADSVRSAADPKADKQRYYLLAHGSHLVDTARFLGGAILGVQAHLVTKFDAYCWMITAFFADGCVGHLNLTVAVRGDWDEGFVVYGEKGTITGKTYLPWFHKSSDVACFSAEDGEIHRPLGEDAYTYKGQIEGFADTILYGTPQWGAGVDDGVAAVRALAAIAHSVASRRRVDLADVTGAIPWS